MRQEKVLVLAHRGGSREYYENTINGFKRAVDSGVNGLEMDLFLTKDEQVVVVHDRKLNR